MLFDIRLTFLFTLLKHLSVYLEWILGILGILPFLWDYLFTLSPLAPGELQVFKTIRNCLHCPPLAHRQLRHCLGAAWVRPPPGLLDLPLHLCFPEGALVSPVRLFLPRHSLSLSALFLVLSQESPCFLCQPIGLLPSWAGSNPEVASRR